MGKYLQYKCVVFDIDNTLYDEKEYFEATFGKISNVPALVLFAGVG